MSIENTGRFTPQPVGNPNDVTTINDNFDNIADALNNVLSRYNNLPNSMNTTLDMNGYGIINQANPVTLETFNWRGLWETATSYSGGDAVFFNSTSYICIIPNTSSSSFLTDLLANKWFNIDLGTSFRGSWASATAYYIGDIVISSNQFYYCTINHLSGGSINLSNFVTYGAFGSIAAQNSNAVSITGGTASGLALTGSTINSSIIGGSSPASGTFTTAFDGGGAPSAGNQLCNRNYVNGTVGSASTSFPGGLIIKTGTITVAQGDVNVTTLGGGSNLTLFGAANVITTFGTPFPNNVFSVSLTMTRSPTGSPGGSGFISSGVICQDFPSLSAFTTQFSALGGSTAIVSSSWVVSWVVIGN